MNNSQLQRAMELSQKTGDRIVVFDGQNDINGYVIMTFGEYEKLLSEKNIETPLTEDGLIDKINRDIAIWKSKEDFNSLNSEETKDFSAKNFETNEKESFPWEVANKFNFTEEAKESETRKHWAIPKERKQAAEEIIEEDRQYLLEI